VAPTLEDAAKSTHTLLPTFTKDGRPKPTPRWAAADGDRSFWRQPRRVTITEAPSRSRRYCVDLQER
jgi:hypothetical protein